MLVYDRLFIGGQWVKPAGSAVVEIISPTTEEPIGRVPESVPADFDLAIAAARTAFDDGPWPRMSVAERGEYLLRVADILEPKLNDAVNVQIDEMGGTRRFLQDWTLGLGMHIRGAVAQVQQIPFREIRQGVAGDVLVMREPVGVVAAVIPWNCPVLFVLSKLLPAVLTGCPIIIKPAPETPLSAYLVAEALEQAGLPRGVVSIIAGGREVGEHLISHPAVDKVSFTGSTAAGRRIGAICGEQIKACTLELGGKSAAILLDDADLDRHISSLVASSMLNTGQACVATTRILAPADRYKDILAGLVETVADLKVGDPHELDTHFGPLAGARHRERVEGYIRLGVEEGATLAFGGGRPAIGKGWFVEPTIFADVRNDMRIAQEEIFGPVVSVIPYDTESDAIRIANDSSYGLGGGIYTSDIERGLRVAAQIRTGTLSINDGPIGGGGGPAGGYKQSGIGREFSLEGFTNHCELKSVALPAGFHTELA